VKTGHSERTWSFFNISFNVFITQAPLVNLPHGANFIKRILLVTFTVLGSVNPVLIFFKRKKTPSSFPSAINRLCLRSSDIIVSAASFRSTSTRLAT